MADVPFMDEERHGEQARQDALWALRGQKIDPLPLDREITPEEAVSAKFSKSPFGYIDRGLKAGTDWIKGRVAKRKAPFEKAGVAPTPIDPVELVGTMLTEGGRTANRWLAAAGGHGPMLRDEDLLGPLGASAMGAPFVAKAGAHLGSAGGKVPAAPFATSQPLDMSEAARMARAKEMGFDTERPLYHGTNKGDFDEFKIGSPGYNSTVFGSEPATRSAVFTAEDPALAKEFADQGGKSGRVMDLFGRSENPLDLSKYGFQNMPDEFFTENGFNRRYYDGLQPWETWRAFDDAEGGKDLVEALKKGGYDAAKLMDYSSGDVANTTSWAFFDPSQLRRTDAAFDPSKADSANLLAANPGTETILEALRAQQQLAPFTSDE